MAKPGNHKYPFGFEMWKPTKALGKKLVRRLRRDRKAELWLEDRKDV